MEDDIKHRCGAHDDNSSMYVLCIYFLLYYFGHLVCCWVVGNKSCYSSFIIYLCKKKIQEKTDNCLQASLIFIDVLKS